VRFYHSTFEPNSTLLNDNIIPNNNKENNNKNNNNKENMEEKRILLKTGCCTHKNNYEGRLFFLNNINNNIIIYFNNNYEKIKEKYYYYCKLKENKGGTKNNDEDINNCLFIFNYESLLLFWNTCISSSFSDGEKELSLNVFNNLVNFMIDLISKNYDKIYNVEEKKMTDNDLFLNEILNSIGKFFTFFLEKIDPISINGFQCKLFLSIFRFLKRFSLYSSICEKGFDIIWEIALYNNSSLNLNDTSSPSKMCSKYILNSLDFFSIYFEYSNDILKFEQIYKDRILHFFKKSFDEVESYISLFSSFQSFSPSSTVSVSPSSNPLSPSPSGSSFSSLSSPSASVTPASSISPPIPSPSFPSSSSVPTSSYSLQPTSSSSLPLPSTTLSSKKSHNLSHKHSKHHKHHEHHHHHDHHHHHQHNQSQPKYKNGSFSIVESIPSNISDCNSDSPVVIDSADENDEITVCYSSASNALRLLLTLLIRYI
jgi:hypothetical protein